MTTVGISVSFSKTGPASTIMFARTKMLAMHRDFSRSVVGVFAETIESTAPRSTGFMATRLSTVRQIRTGGAISGYGAGAYSLVGDPSNAAKRGTITSFIKNYPKLRGSRPMSSSGAWWTLTTEGKERLQTTRRYGAYGGPKPAYWYAIVRGLVPNAVGGTLPENDFVSPAIDAADQYRRGAAAWVFGGVDMRTTPLAIEGSSWTFV